MAGVCARKRGCGCHLGDWLLTKPANNGAVTNYRDPTAREAIHNIERDKQPPNLTRKE